MERQHCGVRINSQTLQQLDRDLTLARQARVTLDDESLLYLSVVYLILPTTSVAINRDFIPLIRANHSMMQKVYRGLQSFTIYNSEQYPDQQRTGSTAANIQFLPAKASDLSEEHHNIVFFLPEPGRTAYDGYQSVETEIRRQGFVFQTGVMYVMITVLGSDSPGFELLGEAEGFVKTKLALHYKAIGSAEKHQDNDFSKGLVLCHEMGHCLGLMHPFPSTDEGFVQSCQQPNNGIVPNCSGTLVDCWHQAFYNETLMVPQRKPNFLANTTSDNAFQDGQLRHGMDNRDLDDLLNKGQITLTDYSDFSAPFRCPTTEPPGTTPYEYFANIMDYAKDDFRTGFTAGSKKRMRQVLTGFQEVFGDVTNPQNGVAVVNAAPSFAPELPQDDSSNSALLIGLIVGGILLVLLLAGGGYVWYHEKRRVEKKSAPYVFRAHVVDHVL